MIRGARRGEHLRVVYPMLPDGETVMVETQKGRVATGGWKSAAPLFVVIPQGWGRPARR